MNKMLLWWLNNYVFHGLDISLFPIQHSIDNINIFNGRLEKSLCTSSPGRLAKGRKTMVCIGHKIFIFLAEKIPFSFNYSYIYLHFSPCLWRLCISCSKRIKLGLNHDCFHWSEHLNLLFPNLFFTKCDNIPATCKRLFHNDMRHGSLQEC